MKIRAAPDPRDVLWSNVTIPASDVKARGRISTAALIFGLVFWSALVAFCQALSKPSPIIDVLSSIFPDWMLSRSRAKKLLQSYLPTLALLGLIQLLPIILGVIARTYVRRKSNATIQRYVMTRYFWSHLV